MLQWTLLNIKPDAVERNIIGAILKRVEDKGYRIVELDKVQLERAEAESFYAVHRGRPFFDDLCDYICSGPCVPVVVEGEDVVQGIRDLIGATNPAEAEEGTIRKDFGIDLSKNSVHASDSHENAKEEISFFFSRKELLLFSHE